MHATYYPCRAVAILREQKRLADHVAHENHTQGSEIKLPRAHTQTYTHRLKHDSIEEEMPNVKCETRSMSYQLLCVCIFFVNISLCWDTPPRSRVQIRATLPNKSSCKDISESNDTLASAIKCARLPPRGTQPAGARLSPGCLASRRVQHRQYKRAPSQSMSSHSKHKTL